MYEIILCRRFKFEFSEGPESVGMATGATIHTANGLKVKIQKREVTSDSSEPASEGKEPLAVAA